MTHVCCPSCRIRFSRETEAALTACPTCGGDLSPLPGVLGYKLFEVPPQQPPLLEALVASRRPSSITPA